MKTLIILVCISLSIGAFAQDQSADNSKVIYRGFVNKVHFPDLDTKDLEVEGVNCEVQSSDTRDNKSLIVRTKSKEQSAQINFISNGKLIHNEKFMIKNLPTPSLYWGENKSGTTASKEKVLELKYEPGVELEADFKITKWGLQHAAHNFSGAGNMLSDEALEYISTLHSGEIINIVIYVLGPDGVTRKLAGKWKS